MGEHAFSDPLDWRDLKAPSLDEMEVIAIEAFRRLPTQFRTLCEDLVIRVEDFPTEEVLDQMGAESEFDLSACSKASACRSVPRARRSRCRT